MSKFIEEIVEIPEERNYWFVRTNGGDYFQDFFFKNFISTEYNVVPIEVIKQEKKKIAIEILKDEYPEHMRPSLIYGHLKRFINEMKAGDIVIIPGKNSDIIAFGEIEDSKIKILSDEEKYTMEEDKFFFKYQRKVRWIKHFEKDNIDIYLMKLLNTHLTINCANEYSNYIDRALHNLYIKNNELHFNINVTKKDAISAITYTEFLSKTFEIVELFNSGSYIEDTLNLNDIKIKTTLNSPGVIELYGSIKTIFLLGSVIVFICGGKIELNSSGLSFETEGLPKLLETFTKFSNAKKESDEMKLLKKKIQELEINLQKKDKEEI